MFPDHWVSEKTSSEPTIDNNQLNPPGLPRCYTAELSFVWKKFQESLPFDNNTLS